MSYGQKKLNNDGQNFNLIRIFAIIAHKNGNMQCKPETERPLFQPLLNPRSGKVLEPGEIHWNLRKAEVQQIRQGAKMHSAKASVE